MVVSSSSLGLAVQRCEPVLITPSEPTPYEMKYLSDIDDQEFLRYQIPVIQYYRKREEMVSVDPVQIIKQAVAKTLVYYYPFAGRLREGSNRKLMVECTGEGVLFIEANANVALDQFSDPLLPPFEALDELLYNVPGSGSLLNCPLLLIQVTRLTCGGFVFALRLNHTMSDAFGLVQLMKAIGEMARGTRSPSVEPVWRRDLLTVRENSSSVSDVPIVNIIPMDADTMVYGLASFSPADVSKLRNHLPSHLRSCSTFEIVTATLWRCRTIALGLNDSNEVVRVQYAVNARNMSCPPLPVGYYGNAMASATADSMACKLCDNPLSYALYLVKKAKAEVADEYMRSLADYKARSSVQPVRTYAVADVRRAGFGEVDFGWGKPVYGGPAKGDVGIVHGVMSFYLPMKTNEGEDGLAATISLPRTTMQKFEIELDKLKEDPFSPEVVPRM